MRLTSFNTAAMLLMLAIGIALGALVFRNVPDTMAAIDRPLAQPVTASSPAIATALDGQEPSAFTRLSDDAKYAGVVFARQSADIVARADGTLQAVFVNLGDRLKAGDVIARAESYSSTQQLQMAEATLRSAHAEQQDAELGVKDAETRYRRREALEEAGLIS